jgi:hypothetical protein
LSERLSLFAFPLPAFALFAAGWLMLLFGVSAAGYQIFVVRPHAAASG